jgi:pimeloyl-ACP methyl ester carboxylesterase
MRLKRDALVVAGLGALAGALAAGTYLVGSRRARGWRVDDEAMALAGLNLPSDLVHHHIPVDDGGNIHAVERGEGPAIVLVHGVTLGVGTWVHQLKQLAGSHRVIAISQRGHGESKAGEDGYSFDRMALDIIEVLHALDVHNAVYVGHSMGGMVGQTAAVNAPKQFNDHISGLVLLATAAGPLVPSPRGVPIAMLLAGGAGRGMKYPTQRGTLLPHEDLGSWIVRSTFGLHPRSTDLALARSLTAAMSPEAMTQLIPSLLSFDVHREIGAIDLPTRVVVGSRDLLTPPRMARAMAAAIPGAELTLLPGSGHMVMLERPDELNRLLHQLSELVS